MVRWYGDVPRIEPVKLAFATIVEGARPTQVRNVLGVAGLRAALKTRDLQCDWRDVSGRIGNIYQDFARFDFI